MRRARGAFLAAAVAVAGAAPVLWPDSALAQRQGAYDVRGTAADGSPYEGVLVMRQAGLASWQVLWQIGEARFEGFGMASGGTFAVGYTVGPRPAIAIYTLAPDGGMTGQWTVVGSNAIGTETLVPREDGAPPAGLFGPGAQGAAPAPAPAQPAPRAAAPPAPARPAR